MAIRQALSSACTLWQGPPGTGKTRTLLALIRVLCAAGLPDSRPLLATADTNAAVDNLVEGLVGCGIRVVRVGQPAKVRLSLVEHSLEARAAQTTNGTKVCVYDWMVHACNCVGVRNPKTPVHGLTITAC